jgi:pimeloyl-ACP methyl ester carboxylesterase
MTATRFENVTTALLEQVGRVVMATLDGPDETSSPDGPTEPGGPVVVVGGMAATEPVMLPLARRLAARGHDVATVTTSAGLGCAGAAVDTLVERIRETADDAGRPVGVVGHSRGGQFARIAVGRPEVAGDVESLVTLGTPFDLYGLSWPLIAQAAGLVVAGTLGVPGLARFSCLTGACCREFRTTLRRTLPPGMPFTSIYSRADRTVPAEASIDPGARNVEVGGGHLSLLTGVGARRAVADALDASTATVGLPQNRPVSA